MHVPPNHEDLKRILYSGSYRHEERLRWITFLGGMEENLRVYHLPC